MVTIEHEFDATLVTLIDEGPGPLGEDVVIAAYDDRVTVSQVDPATDAVLTITLSSAQVRDLRAALDLPEGMYQAGPRPR